MPNDTQHNSREGGAQYNIGVVLSFKLANMLIVIMPGVALLIGAMPRVFMLSVALLIGIMPRHNADFCNAE